MIANPSPSQLITALYNGLFGRAPEYNGLHYWLDKMNQGQSFEEIATGFTQDSTYKAKVGSLSDEAFVKTLYNNVLGRDPVGNDVSYWTNQISALGRDKVAAMFVKNALTDDPDAIAQANNWTAAELTTAKAAQAATENKIKVGIYFAETLGPSKTALNPAGFLDPSLWAYDPVYKAAQDILKVVTDDPASVAAAASLINTAASKPTLQEAMQVLEQSVATGGGQTFMLTTDPESKTGTSGNDTFNGSDTTLVLDVLDGAGGNDTLNYSDATGGTDINSLGLSLTSIETINVRSTGAASATTTGFAGVENVNVLLGTSATVDAATTTNVSVSGVTGAITVDGGKNITVTDSTANNAISIGGTTAATGKVVVTDSKQGTGTISIDGGTDVTVTASNAAASGGDIIIGSNTKPTGAVAVTSNHVATAGTDVTMGNISVTGGTTVTVTQTADTSKAANDTTGATLTQGDVTVVGGGATTSVTVKQAASQAQVAAVAGVAGSTETASVKFGALKAGDKLIMGGNGDTTLESGELQITALVDLTAAEVAQAFANLLNPDTQGSGVASKVTYSTSGTTSKLTTWTSGAASGDTVVFTSTTPNSNVTDLAFGLVNTSGNSVAPTVTTTDGASATAAVTGRLGVITGAVTIKDAATASITDVVIDGYGNTTIGQTNALTKLQNLTLANSGGSTAGATNASVSLYDGGITSLNLTLNNVQGAVNLDADGTASIKTLTLTATGKDSTSALTAAAVETLTVKGDKLANISSGTLSALKTVTVSGSAGLNLGGAASTTLESVNTTGTTGAVTVSIDGTKATYTGGAGVDNVTVTNPGTAISKAISLGDGNDRLDLSVATAVVPTVTLDGGAGTDTLKLTAGAASTLSGSTAFKDKLSGFERLELTAAGNTDGTSANVAIDLDKLGFTNYVISNGTVNDGANSDVLKLDNFASGGTLVIATAAAVANTQHTVNVKDAATGTADVLNVELQSASDLNAGTLTVAEVETVNLKATDTDTTNGINSDSLTLTANKATSVNITGNAHLTLTLTGSTKVTSIDASSGYTGNLTVTSLNATSATTIKGGSGNDVLTAATGTTADKLFGGAGDDVLTANAGLTEMTGGAGRDTFVINTASLNVNSYATILDFTKDDLIKLDVTGGVVGFAASKVTLAPTAVFQDYANAAMNALDTTTAGGSLAAWFQYGGDTYIVVDVDNGGLTSDSTTFVNGEDFIVKIAGLVDLSQASFNDTHGTIALV